VKELFSLIDFTIILWN